MESAFESQIAIKKTKPLKYNQADPPIVVGMFYMVRKKDNRWAAGEVLHERFNRQKKVMEYYVHYLSLDRRLDEWVRSHRIKTSLKSDTSQIKYDLVPVITYDSDSGSLESDDAEEKEHIQVTRIKLLKVIQFWCYEIDTWYFSPYPGGFVNKEKLYICNFCFKYTSCDKSYNRHLSECIFMQPPGAIVYERADLAIFQVDGACNKLYCQNLSLLAKLFIDHKTQCYDVEQFLFFILCCRNIGGHKDYFQFKGFFSRDKDYDEPFNLSCILILPPFQKQGLGKLLIDFSYTLSKLERIPGSPEEPISDLGLLSYRSYWQWIILNELVNQTGDISLVDLSMVTGISECDIVYTLETLKLLHYWNGSSNVIIRQDSLKKLIESGKFRRPSLLIVESCVFHDRIVFKKPPLRYVQ